MIFSYHLIPHSKGWAIRRTGYKKNSFILKTRRCAERKLNKLISGKKYCVYLHFGINGAITEYYDNK
jgi:hypothetical protein